MATCLITKTTNAFDLFGTHSFYSFLSKACTFQKEIMKSILMVLVHVGLPRELAMRVVAYYICIPISVGVYMMDKSTNETMTEYFYDKIEVYPTDTHHNITYFRLGKYYNPQNKDRYIEDMNIVFSTQTLRVMGFLTPRAPKAHKLFKIVYANYHDSSGYILDNDEKNACMSYEASIYKYVEKTSGQNIYRYHQTIA